MTDNGTETTNPGTSSPMDEQEGGGQEDRFELDPGNRPTGIRAICLVSLDGRPIIRLQVQGKDNRILMDSSQDLEDTLALGAFIVDASADVLEDTAKLLKPSAWREGIGEHFESYLEKTETATRRIRQQLSEVKTS